MGLFSSLPIIGGLINTVGNNVIRGREAFKGNAEAEQQRVADDLKDARKFAPKGWFSRQIRPLITLIVYLPYLVITIVITIVCVKVMIPLLHSLDDIDRAIGQMQAVFGLYDALPDRLWVLIGVVTPLWFGGRAIKHLSSTSIAKHAVSVNANRPRSVQPRDNKFVDLLGADISKLSKLEQARQANARTK